MPPPTLGSQKHYVFGLSVCLSMVLSKLLLCVHLRITSHFLISMITGKPMKGFPWNVYQLPPRDKDELIRFSAYLVNFQGNGRAKYGIRGMFGSIWAKWLRIKSAHILSHSDFSGMTKYGKCGLLGLFLACCWTFYHILGCLGCMGGLCTITAYIRSSNQSIQYAQIW